MSNFDKKTVADWEAQAKKEKKTDDLSGFKWDTPEGITVKPLYTEEDLVGLKSIGSLPGSAPYTRGPMATMYAGRPWTVRQYAGFRPPKSQTPFTSEILPPANKGFLSLSTSPPIAVTIRIIRASSVMSARRVSPSTRSRI